VKLFASVPVDPDNGIAAYVFVRDAENRLRQEVVTALNEIDKKFDKLDERIDKKLDKLDKKIDDNAGKLDSLVIFALIVAAALIGTNPELKDLAASLFGFLPKV
jgi:enoyl-[acyl-carrier-protein] reductase (NADH)